MDQAIDAYDTITAASEFREKERLRAKARHDEAQALYHAKMEGRKEGWNEGRNEGLNEGRNEGRHEEKYEIARFLLAEGDSIEKIARCTGLTHQELEGLNHAG